MEKDCKWMSLQKDVHPRSLLSLNVMAWPVAVQEPSNSNAVEETRESCSEESCSDPTADTDP